jgi:hypothetical protein
VRERGARIIRLRGVLCRGEGHERLGSGSRVLKEAALDPLSGKTPADVKLNVARAERICFRTVKM